MSSFSSFVRLSRPHFLFGGALMYAIGVVSGDEITVGGFLLGQVLVTSAQVTAHYVNEYADVEADRLVINRTFFSGGSGAIVDGGLTRSVALRSAVVSSLVALLAAGFVMFLSPLAAVLGVMALGVSWVYSIPPVRLLNTGWGELATSLVVVVLVPLIGVLITDARPPADLWWAMAVLLPIHIAMMLIFEIPDAMTDREAGKTVLAVRIGEPGTVRLIALLYALSGLIAILGRPKSVGTEDGFLVVAGIAALLVGTVFLSLRRRRFGLATSAAVGVLVVLGGVFLGAFQQG